MCGYACIHCGMCGKVKAYKMPQIAIPGICKKCGTLNGPTSTVCKNCGKALQLNDFKEESVSSANNE